MSYYSSIAQYSRIPFGVFDPESISGLIAWYDASDSSTLTFGTGSAVSGFADKTSEGNDLSQGSATLQPAQVTASQNGLDVLRFDGTDRIKRTTFTGGVESQANTIIIALLPDSGTGSTEIYIDGGEVDAERHAIFQNGSDNYAIFTDSSAASTTTRDTSFVVLGAIFDGSSSLLYRNAVEILSGSSPGTNPMNGVTLGANGNGGGGAAYDLGEVWIYDNDIGTTNLVAAMNGMMNKWGVS